MLLLILAMFGRAGRRRKGDVAVRPTYPVEFARYPDHILRAMSAFIVANEPWIRFGCFAGVFVLMAAWEVLAPKRPLTLGRRPRWPANLGIVALNGFLTRVLLPVAAVGTAVFAAEAGWGLFNAMAVPGWFAFVASVLILDLVVYGQHFAFHHVPVLWRLHRMHHADQDIDVTTGARFHPVEIAISMILKMIVVALIGAPAAAVVLFEILLNATSMFNHGNVAMPAALDRALRLFVVTPDMHRVHHSIVRTETDSNFGFNVPWWDRLFGTYREAPAAGHLGMTVGITLFRAPEEQRLGKMLLQPWRNDRPGVRPTPEKAA